MTDLALLLARHGYDAVARDRAARGGGDSYPTRLLGRRAVVVGTPAGVRAFYAQDDDAPGSPGRVRRRDAVPAPLAHLLFGRGAVHALDDGEHDRRKALLRGLVGTDAVREVAHGAAERLQRRVAVPNGEHRVLADELVDAYGAAALHWAGVRLPPRQARRTSRRLAGVVAGFGFQPVAYARAWRHRRWADGWATDLVERVRAGTLTASPQTPLAVLARRTELDPRTAGVELLNLVRPTVAVAWLGTFAGRALALHPQWRERLADPGDDAARLAFAHEVRRATPFVPALAAVRTTDGEVDGVPVAAGERMVLDVMGLLRHPDQWRDPGAFRPERFLEGGLGQGREPADPAVLVPQGGGPIEGHRCPGEDLALALLGSTVEVLATARVEPVDLGEVSTRRIPTLPRGGVLLRCA